MNWTADKYHHLFWNTLCLTVLKEHLYIILLYIHYGHVIPPLQLTLPLTMYSDTSNNCRSYNFTVLNYLAICRLRERHQSFYLTQHSSHRGVIAVLISSDPHKANSEVVIICTIWCRKHLQCVLKRGEQKAAGGEFLTSYRINPGDRSLQRWKSFCIKADRCVNRLSLSGCMCTHTHTVQAGVWVLPKETDTCSLLVGLNSKLACSVAFLLLLLLLTSVFTTQFWTIVRRRCAFTRLIKRLTTPDTVSGVFHAQNLLRGCTVGASRQDGCEEGSTVEGPSWATGDWLQTGSRLTGPRSRGTNRNPAKETTFIKMTFNGFE